MPRNQSEKTGIIDHKTVTPANWVVPAHALMFEQDGYFWVMCHSSSTARHIDYFLGRRYPTAPEAQHLFDELLDNFWFANLSDELRGFDDDGARLAPPGWLESKERKQCVKERERL